LNGKTLVVSTRNVRWEDTLGFHSSISPPDTVYFGRKREENTGSKTLSVSKDDGLGRHLLPRMPPLMTVGGKIKCSRYQDVWRENKMLQIPRCTGGGPVSFDGGHLS